MKISISSKLPRKSISAPVVKNEVVDSAKKALADAGIKCVLDSKGSGSIVFRLQETAQSVVAKLTAGFGKPVKYKTAISIGWTWDLAEQGVIDIVVLSNTAVGKVRFLTFWKAMGPAPKAEE